MYTLLFCLLWRWDANAKARLQSQDGVALRVSGAGFSPDNAHDASSTKASAVFLSGLLLAEQGDAKRDLPSPRAFLPLALSREM
jgi:hypothetical protein